MSPFLSSARCRYSVCGLLRVEGAGILLMVLKVRTREIKTAPVFVM